MTATKTDPTRSLHRKLAQVMYQAERIPKNGTAPAAMGGFKFVQVGDAADSIRKALAEKSVSMIPTAIELLGETEHQTAGGKAMTTMTVRTTWTLTDGDSGESTVIQSIGSGADMGDKAAPKAQSSAMKYALLMGFLLSTGDDPEQTDTSDRRPRNVRSADAEDADDNAPEHTDDGTDAVEFLGKLQKVGTIQKGGAALYQGQFHPTPEGHSFGFRLKLSGEDKDIPQVLVKGTYGEALFMAYAGETAGLIGAHVTVKGRLYNVRPQGRRSYYRLVIGEAENDLIETPVVRIPALPDAASATESGADPVEAASTPLFELDDAERAAVAGTLKP